MARIKRDPAAVHEFLADGTVTGRRVRGRELAGSPVGAPLLHNFRRLAALVGYENSSQFGREYQRPFGAPASAERSHPQGRSSAGELLRRLMVLLAGWLLKGGNVRRSATPKSVRPDHSWRSEVQGMNRGRHLSGRSPSLRVPPALKKKSAGGPRRGRPEMGLMSRP
jgi:hypothetical protein